MSLSRLPSVPELRDCYSNASHRWGPPYFSWLYNRGVRQCKTCGCVKPVDAPRSPYPAVTDPPETP